MNEEVLYRTTQRPRASKLVLMHLADAVDGVLHVGFFNTEEEALDAAVLVLRQQLNDNDGWFTEEEVDEHLAVLDRKTVGSIANDMETTIVIKDVEIGQITEIENW